MASTPQPNRALNHAEELIVISMMSSRPANHAHRRIHTSSKQPPTNPKVEALRTRVRDYLNSYPGHTLHGRRCVSDAHLTRQFRTFVAGEKCNHESFTAILDYRISQMNIADAYIEKLGIPFEKCGEFCVEEYLEEWFAKEAKQDYEMGRWDYIRDPPLNRNYERYCLVLKIIREMKLFGRLRTLHHGPVYWKPASFLTIAIAQTEMEMEMVEVKRALEKCKTLNL